MINKAVKSGGLQSQWPQPSWSPPVAQAPLLRVAEVEPVPMFAGWDCRLEERRDRDWFPIETCKALSR